MKRWAKALIAALGLLASPAYSGCKAITHLNIPFTICEVSAEDDLRLWHSDSEGTLYGSFGAVDNALGEDKTLDFAMNAGMYHQDRSPVGLFIENYTERSEIASGGGYGNFGLTPNGVFCIGDNTMQVIETEAYRNAVPNCRYATQSGPMLLINGDLHPRLLPDSDSRYIRNGVGTSADGERAIFAISDRPVNFHNFATLFRDALGLSNALYFDGSVSRLLAADLDRWDIGLPLGVIVGVVVSANR